MNNRLFAHFGEEAVLRGDEPVTVIVSRNVELLGEHGELDRVVTTATFDEATAPRARDPLLVLTGECAGAWRLDAPMASDRAADQREWILLKAAP